MTVGRPRAERGQATVEVIVLLPVVVAVVVAVAAVLAAGAASEAAASAAQAGAAAILQDGDPEAAARQALGPTAGRAEIVIGARTVTVSVRPAVPLGALLTAVERADAGPGPGVERSRTVVRGGDGERSRPSDGERVRP